MSIPIQAVSWDQFYEASRKLRFHCPARIREQVEALRPSTVDFSPFVFDGASDGSLLVVKGKMLAATSDGRPAVYFVAAIPQAFPNAYPILSLEPPPAPWRFAPHPHIDGNGLCYLPSVSQWTPTTSTLLQCLAELQRVLQQQFPFSNPSGSPPPPRPASASAPPIAPQPVRPPAVSPTLVQPPVPASAAGAATAATAAGVQTAFARLGAGGPTVALPADSQWIDALQSREDAAATERGRQAAEKAARARLEAIICGKSRDLPQGIEVRLPASVRLAGVRTASRPDHLPALLGPPPLPGPPVMEPTPDEYYRAVMCERERQIAQGRAAAAAEPEPTSTIGKGWRMLSTGARVLSNAASNAKAAVEDKLRADHAERQRGKFIAHFGQEAGRDRLMATYHATALSGVGTALGGKLFITDRTACWVERRPPPQANEAPHVSQAPLAKFAADFRNVASLVLGEFNGEQTVGICFTSGHVLLLLVVGAGTATAVGSVLTATVVGTPAERCYNWLDHMWRACVPVPVPTQVPTAQSQMPPPPSQPFPVPRSAAAPAVSTASPVVPTAAPAASVASDAHKSTDSSDETSLCAICLDAPRNSFLRPCGHVALCMDCARRMTECPLCRARIQDVFQAYL